MFDTEQRNRDFHNTVSKEEIRLHRAAEKKVLAQRRAELRAEAKRKVEKAALPSIPEAMEDAEVTASPSKSAKLESQSLVPTSTQQNFAPQENVIAPTAPGPTAADTTTVPPLTTTSLPSSSISPPAVPAQGDPRVDPPPSSGGASSNQPLPIADAPVEQSFAVPEDSRYPTGLFDGVYT